MRGLLRGSPPLAAIITELAMTDNPPIPIKVARLIVQCSRMARKLRRFNQSAQTA